MVLVSLVKADIEWYCGHYVQWTRSRIAIQFELQGASQGIFRSIFSHATMYLPLVLEDNEDAHAELSLAVETSAKGVFNQLSSSASLPTHMYCDLWGDAQDSPEASSLVQWGAAEIRSSGSFLCMASSLVKRRTRVHTHRTCHMCPLIKEPGAH